MTAAKPPKTWRDPDQAQARSDFMSLGVIASWHREGLAPSGTREVIYNDELILSRQSMSNDLPPSP